MKHIVYIEGKQHSASSELDYKFAVIGQRDRTKEEVAPPQPVRPDAPQEAREDYQKAIVARRQFTANDAAGRYSMKPLDWAESEEEATAKAKSFKAKGWISVCVTPVDTILPNG